MTTQAQIDLEWNDDHVVPPRVTPDLVFLFDRMIEATVDKVKSAANDLILDVGCGRGVDAIKIAKRGGKPVGLEPSRAMLKHGKDCVSEAGNTVSLVQGIGERLPFKDFAFDWVVCKGALDHFPDPYKAVEEMSRVLKPHGKAVISLANFESLGHRMGRTVHHWTWFVPRKNPDERQAWETPLDHTLRFDHRLMRELVGSYMNIDEIDGISFLWGAPLWDKILSRLPKRLSFFILGRLDRIARSFPSMSDVILMTCSRKMITS